MPRIQEREQQRNRDGFGFGGADRIDQTWYLVLVQLRDHRTVRADPLGDLEPVPARYQDVRRVLEQVI